jgi:hypothetical protein
MVLCQIAGRLINTPNNGSNGQGCVARERRGLPEISDNGKDLAGPAVAAANQSVGRFVATQGKWKDTNRTISYDYQPFPESK